MGKAPPPPKLALDESLTKKAESLAITSHAGRKQPDQITWHRMTYHKKKKEKRKER